MSQAGKYDISAVIIPVQSLTGDAGGAVSPTVGNIDLLGGNNITTTGNPGTSTITVDFTGTTQFSLQLGNASGSLSSLGVAANGAIPIGSVGANPVLAVPTNGNNITWTAGAGSLQADVTGTTQYAIQIGDATNSLDSLAIGNVTQILQSGGAGAIPAWSTATYPATSTQGDVLYSSAANTIVGLAKDATATRYLANTGATNNPAWDQINVTNGITGIVPVTNGGTGIADPADHNILIGSGAAAMTELGVAGNGELVIGSVGADPVLAVPTNGTNITWTAGAGTLQADLVATIAVTLGGTGIVSPTDHALLAGSGAAAMTELAVGATNQVLLGNTGADPSWGQVDLTSDVTGILPVTNGGTGVADPTDHSLVVGSGAAAMTELGVATNGQLVIGSTGADPALAALTSTDTTITVTNGAGTIDLAVGAGMTTDSGFAAWDGAGPYFDDTVLGDFEVSESGYGYINSVRVDWAAPQTVTGLVAGTTYYIYVDNTGTVQKNTSFSQVFLQNNIVLFEVLRDSTAGTNNQVTVKENHPFCFQPAASYWAHESVGVVIENNNNGANITINGTQKIEINGADELSDHGLYTTIPDSGGVAEVFNQYFTLGSGKWARYLQSDTFDGAWDNAGTVTALGANKYSVSRLYVSKDNITVTTPVYFSVLGDAQYNNLTAAQTAIANGDIPVASGELSRLEIAQLGYIIFEESSTSIVDAIIAKETLTSVIVLGGTNQASLVLTDTSNFDHILSVADTNVQAALETIDDLILRGDAASDAQASSAVFTIAGGTGITTTGAGSTVTIDLDSPVLVTNGGTGLASPTDHVLIVGSGAAAMTELAVGATNQVLLGATGADPTWGAVDVTTDVTGLLPIGSGGTGVANLLDHSLLVGSGANTMTELGVATNGQLVIGSTGADPVLAVPTNGTNISWTGGAGTLQADLTATIAVTLGGTGVVSPTDHAIIVGSGAAAMTELAVGATNQVLLGATGADPTWGAVDVTTDITGILPVANGGTGVATVTAHALTVGDDANPLNELTVGATNQVLLGNTGADPSWGQVDVTTDITGIVPATNGGIGIADPTDHTLLVGSGAGAMTELGVATNGQLVIGSVGADPVLAALASADASVTITNGAGTIDLAVVPGFSWNESTGTTQALAVDNGYIANNASQVVCTLPDTAALGSVIRLCGKGAGGWRISQNAGEDIIWDEASSTTGGVGGYLASTDDYDAIEILCTVADTTWTVLTSKGNITIV